jgi:hypothetical protein
MAALLTQHRDDHGPFTGPDVAFDVKDLLPGAEHRPAGAHRRRQARTKQRGLQVGMAVAVVPGLLVSVIPARWNKLSQKRRQVLLQARLELDGAIAAVLPTLKICTMPVRTPDSLIMWATASVRSCISPELCVRSVSSLWKIIWSLSHLSG